MNLLMAAIKTTNALPSGASRDLYNTHPSFNKIMMNQAEKAIAIIEKICQNVTTNKSIVNKDFEDRLHILQDSNDTILERINTNLDEIVGINKKQPPSVQVTTEVKIKHVSNYHLANSSSKIGSPSSPQIVKLVTAKNIIRPQTNFTFPVDNSNNPFLPKLREKPHAIKPFILTPEFDEEGNVLAYQHPYLTEIDDFEPSDDVLKKVEPIKAKNMDEVPYIYVDTKESLNEMLLHLKSANEVAVDVEHHNYRTFQGITCLLQISTREKDFIVDTIALRDDLHILNHVFANPAIVKVLHGADSDVEWLQRDLSLYLVNLFDSHKASKRLGFPRLSLAYLLKYYCDLDVDKIFQLADWRIRPLPEDFLKYAQQDTHYLLYVYDRLRNDLIDAANGVTNLLSTVFHDGKIVCSKRYEKPIFNSQSYKDLYLKMKKSYNTSQLHALKNLYKWRDEVARKEDESYQYVLPNHMLLQISEVLPREMQGILACCNPIPPLVRQNLNELHQIILEARQLSANANPLIGNENVERKFVESSQTRKDFLDNPLYSPHDYRDQGQENEQNSLQLQNDVAKLKINEKPTLKISALQNFSCLTSKPLKLQFLSPYEKFKLMIPFMQEQARKQQSSIVPKVLEKVMISSEKIPIQSTSSKFEETKSEEFVPVTSLSKMKFMQRKAKLAQETATTSGEPTQSESFAPPEHKFTAPQINRWNKKRKFTDRGENFQSSNRPIDFDYNALGAGEHTKRFKTNNYAGRNGQKGEKFTFKNKNFKKNNYKKNNNVKNNNNKQKF